MAISFSTTSTDPVKARTDILAVPVFDGGKLSPSAEAVDSALAGGLKALVKSSSFEGETGGTIFAASGDGVAAKSVLLVGAGKRGKLTADDLRKMAAATARRAKKSAEVTTTLLEAAGDEISEAEAGQAIAEGFVLGAYEFLKHKGAGSNGEASKLRRVKLVGAGDAARRGMTQGEAVAKGVTLARDLINGPAGSVTPRELARVARNIKGVRTTVWDEARCRKEGLGGLLGVAAGSDEPARLIRMTYTPQNARGTVVLVGKGITFDSGGLSLKPTGYIETMKYDMAGAAAVIGTMSIVAELAPPLKVIAIVPTTENMPSGSATKLGDVLTIRNKKTVEVLNTDAEGRLVLSDGLSLAVEDEPDAIVDIATLTGAVHVALGGGYAGVMSNNDDMVELVAAAADRTSERVWELPLPQDYRKQLDSDIADVKNVAAGRYGGAITAALFLQEFVDDVPWAHLDIAGVGWADSPNGYNSKGGTGYGVRLLSEFLLGFRKPKKSHNR